VTPAGPGAYLVSDGRDSDGVDPHRVEISGNIARCDCKGFTYRRRCRHLVAVGEYLVAAPLVDADLAQLEVGPAFDEAPPPDAPPAEPPIEEDPAAPAGPVLDPRTAAIYAQWQQKGQQLAGAHP
jgi:hypothetical protein